MKLKPPKGCAAVSIGGATYALGPDGLIDVPEEHADMLLQSHGFALPDGRTTGARPKPNGAAPIELEQEVKPTPRRTSPSPAARQRGRSTLSVPGKPSRGREE